MGQVSSSVVKTLRVVPTPFTVGPGSTSWLCFYSPLAADGRQHMMAQVPGSLPLTWGTGWSRAPGCALAQPWLWAFEE